MNARLSVIVACSAALIVQGCATASKDLTASYVSPLQYQSYDCDQLRAEAQRIQTRVVQLGGRLDEAANNDKGIMAVGLIIFWPALFALGGTKAQEAEYSRLKGEYDAIEEQAVIKKCPGIAPSAPTTADVQTSPIAPAVATAPAAAASGTSPSPAPAASVAPPPPPAAVLPAAVAQPAPSAALPPPVPSVQPVGLKTASRHMFSAERFAKENGCASPVATMSLQRAESETFTITCASGEAMIVRCEGSVCRALQ